MPAEPTTVADLVRVAQRDPVSAVLLCAWFSERAQLLPEPERQSTLAALGPLAAGASAAEIDDARRYAALRARIVGLAGQRSAIPRVAPSASIDDAISSGDRSDWMKRATVIGMGGSAAAFFLGLVASAFWSGLGGLLLVVAAMAFVGFWYAYRWIGRLLEYAAMQAAMQSNAAVEADVAHREIDAAIASMDASGDLTWLRTLGEKHPDVRFPELEALTR